MNKAEELLREAAAMMGPLFDEAIPYEEMDALRERIRAFLSEPTPETPEAIT